MLGLLQNYLAFKAFDTIAKKIGKQFNNAPTKVIAVNNSTLFTQDRNQNSLVPVRDVKENEVIGNLVLTGYIILNGRKLKIVKVHNQAFNQEYVVLHNDVKFKNTRPNVIR